MAKIMVVDDSEVIRFQLKEDLTNEGHEVIEAYDGFERSACARTTFGRQAHHL